MLSTASEKASFARLLTDLGDLVHVERGETIYHPGSASTSVFVVEKGRIKLAYLDESGKKLTLSILDQGEIFGEMCLVGEKFRRHLASAIDDTILRCVPRKEFTDAISADLDGLQRRIRRTILERGTFYIVQAELRGRIWLRCTLITPRTTLADLEACESILDRHVAEAVQYRMMDKFR